MTAHVVEIDTQHSWDGDRMLPTRYRWRCSCGQTGAWKTSARWARAGGEQHRAKMEK